MSQEIKMPIIITKPYPWSKKAQNYKSLKPPISYVYKIFMLKSSKSKILFQHAYMLQLPFHLLPVILWMDFIGLWPCPLASPQSAHWLKHCIMIIITKGVVQSFSDKTMTLHKTCYSHDEHLFPLSQASTLFYSICHTSLQHTFSGKQSC